MIKKALLGMAVALGLGTFVFGRDVMSYARTWGASVRDAVKQEVPLEFQVQTAREMVEKIVPDIRDTMHVIAEQQVEVEHRGEEIATRSTDLGKQKEAILALRDHLENGPEKYVTHRRAYSRDEVKRDLSARFERFKIAQETLQREEQILAARQKALEANQQKLDNMLVAKKDLEVKIEQLEARLQAIQAVETVSTLEIDQTQLARAKKLIRELDRQLDVREKLLDAEGQFAGLIPVDTQEIVVSEDIAERVDAYFGPDAVEESHELDRNEL